MVSGSLLGEGMDVMERGEGRAAEDGGIQRRKGIGGKEGAQHLDLCRPSRPHPTPLHWGHTTHHHLVAVYRGFIHPYGFKDLLWPKATF